MHRSREAASLLGQSCLAAGALVIVGSINAVLGTRWLRGFDLRSVISENRAGLRRSRYGMEKMQVERVVVPSPRTELAGSWRGIVRVFPTSGRHCEAVTSLKLSQAQQPRCEQKEMVLYGVECSSELSQILPSMRRR
ncbi:uncharacterized protein BDZ99DRAFT_189192 [Mytilinidion resinicola]|uniref:Uncharacterized protein n=1 Tax=Mytilinidion resinicola TaxID=574789 RepID=A0A6A6Z422_9PEZI|nr:uncharacterized protein BDZ99DRAFT_189192 [Mytilinidion resinicola]KAF2815034.1 hypothetical protein BDZ99DRAFT_189192 [Mytilinidion resinicola]